MKITTLLFFILTITHTTFSQISFYIDKDLSWPDLRVRVGEDVSFPDARIKIGENISFEDFTVKVSDNKTHADFIIVDSKSEATKAIRASEDVSFPDIRIRAGKDISFADLKIEIKKTGSADYIIYSENLFLTMNDLVVALLPAINQHLNHKWKKLPVYLSPSQSNNHYDLIKKLDRASIVGQNSSETFLGLIDDRFKSKSIFNTSGRYGNKAFINIWNDCSIYGNSYGTYSAFNENASKPPKIMKNGQIIGYLTLNSSISKGISPYIVKALKDKF